MLHRLNTAALELRPLLFACQSTHPLRNSQTEEDNRADQKGGTWAWEEGWACHSEGIIFALLFPQEPNPGPLQKQQVFLTTESLLQPQVLFVCLFVCFYVNILIVFLEGGRETVYFKPTFCSQTGPGSLCGWWEQQHVCNVSLAIHQVFGGGWAVPQNHPEMALRRFGSQYPMEAHKPL